MYSVLNTLQVKSMKCLKILDVGPMVYAVMPKLTDLAPDGFVRLGLEPTYTELSYRLMMATATKPYADYDTDYLFVNDAETYFRRQLLPEYKGRRSPKPSCYSSAVQALNKIPHITVPNFEADDLIAYAVLKLQDEYDHILIYTSDHDLLQLVNDKVWVVKTAVHNKAEAVMCPKTTERWYTKKIINKWPKDKTGSRTKKWKCPKQHSRAKYWQGNCKDSTLKMKYEMGDSSDNYTKHQDAIIYNLYISPIHAMDLQLPIMHTSEELYQGYLEGLQKWINKGNSPLRDYITDPDIPRGDPYQEDCNQLGSEPFVQQPDSLAGFGWE